MTSSHERRYDLDWLRVLAVLLLVPFLFGVLTFIPFTTYVRRLGTLSFWEHYLGFFRFDLEHLDGYSGTFTPAHLWFILFLFVFSLVALPLFLVLRTETGRRAVRALGTAAQAPASLIVWCIPLALVASLDSLGDKNPLYYLLVFMYGYVLASDKRFQPAIDKLTWAALAYGLFEAVFRVMVPQWHYTEWTWQWAALGLMYEMGRWSLTLAMLGLGHRFLNRTNRFLRYARAAAMPFYLLHMTFSVLAGYFVIKLSAPVAVKYLLIVFSATGLTLLAYELVRRWNLTRWLFGMRPIQKEMLVPAVANMDRQPS